jgi:hypothetical protein
VIAFCPRCGTDFPELVLGEMIQTALICPGCRLAPADAPEMLAPADDELEYQMDDWPVVDRVVFTEALVGNGIPYRWEPGLSLIVPPATEEQVDNLLENFDTLVAAAEAEDTDEGDGGEEAYQVMSDLFLIADRLQHAPYDTRVTSEFRKFGPVVENTLPPFGVERPVWRRVQSMTGAIVALIEADAEGEEITAEAAALRHLLRDYI